MRSATSFIFICFQILVVCGPTGSPGKNAGSHKRTSEGGVGMKTTDGWYSQQEA